MTPSNSSGNANLFRFMLVTGLMIGTLDGTAAIIDFITSYHGNPLIEFQYIAGGFLGIKTFSGGLPTALLGIFLHYLIATSWTVLFFLLYPKMKVLRMNWLFVGLVYAIFIWLVMNLIVRPLSLVPHVSWTTFKVFKSAAILVVVVGSPISFVARKFYSENSNEHQPAA